MLSAGVAAALVAVIATAFAALWGLSHAEQQITRASKSYEQLALATELDAGIGRLLVEEISRIVAPASRAPSNQDAISATIERLIEAIRVEVESLEDEAEKRIEREEYRAAYAVRALFANMQHSLVRHRTRVSNLGSGQNVLTLLEDVVATDYAHLDRIIREIVDGERREVRDTLEELVNLRAKAVTTASAALTGIAILAIALAIVAYRSIMRPLDELATGASALADGQYTHRIAVSGPSEIARLARGFNHMADRIVAGQAALTAANESLERTVAARTRELEEKASRLMEIDATRRLFFAKIGHELRTPLSVLLGEAELALGAKRATLENQAAALERILVDGRYLQRRIDDLLALARSQDGRISISRTTVDLRETVESVATTAGAYALLHDVELAVRIPDARVDVEADPDWLRQGLLALVDNAIKYAVENGCVEIELDTAPNGARLSVRDNGPGVAEDEIPKLFAPFFRSKSATSGGRHGAGLGLAVANWVSVSHGGRIEAHNGQAGGFCVSIILPTTPPQHANGDTIASDESPARRG